MNPYFKRFLRNGLPRPFVGFHTVTAEANMRMFKLVAAVGLLLATAACAVYTNDYPPDRYYAYHHYYGPPQVAFYTAP